MKVDILIGICVLSIAAGNVVIQVKQDVVDHGDSCCCGGCPCAENEDNGGNDVTPTNTTANDVTPTNTTANDVTPTNTTAPVTCDTDNGWVLYTVACYLIVTGNARSWDDAQSYCQSQYGEDLLPQTSEIYNAIYSTIYNNFTGGDLWVGAKKANSGDWLLPDGDPIGSAVTFADPNHGCGHYKKISIFGSFGSVITSAVCTSNKDFVCGFSM